MYEYRLRRANEGDIEAIRNIYAPYVLETVITFEMEVPSVEELTERFSGIVSDYPYLVCTRGDKLVGYAYAHRHMERAAYQWNAELSIYLDPSCHGKGLGKKIYAALIEILKFQNVKTVYGCVTTGNPKSERMHAALGFSRIGIYDNAGYKCGAWHDVAWFEKSIGIYDLEPSPFVSIKNIEDKVFEDILSGALGNSI